MAKGGTPSTIGQVFQALQRQPDKAFYGAIPRDLALPEASDTRFRAKAVPYPVHVEFLHVTWAGSDEDRVCFFDSKYHVAKVGLNTPVEELIEATRKRYATAGAAVDAIDSLASAGARPVWPPAPTAQKLDHVEVESDVEDTSSAIVTKRLVKLKVCAARPAITAATRFLVVHFDAKSTMHAGLVDHPALMVFGVTDDGSVDLTQ